MLTILRELLHSQVSRLNNEHVGAVIGSMEGLSTAYDNIQISIYDDFFYLFGPILTSICNNSLSLGIFPHELAIGKVICLHRTMISN